ncbi:MAG TPA: hypothetical protein VID04_12250 [Methylomirabilota bacterium]|jgi:hypothetical protein
MRGRLLLITLPLCVGLAACGGTEREWMKINESYTKEEFRRDVAQCTHGITLDEACMKSRGWVSVTAKQAKPAEQQPPQQPGIPPPRYR